MNREILPIGLEDCQGIMSVIVGPTTQFMILLSLLRCQVLQFGKYPMKIRLE